MKKIVIYTDGGSRGNPGPFAAGFVFCDGNGRILKKYSEFLGEGTNNEAEYLAVILALKKFKALFGKKTSECSEIEIRSDSELLVSQMQGRYKISEKGIQELFLALWNLKIDFGKVEFKLIPREENKEADKLANEALDGQQSARRLF